MSGKNLRAPYHHRIDPAVHGLPARGLLRPCDERCQRASLAGIKVQCRAWAAEPGAVGVVVLFGAPGTWRGEPMAETRLAGGGEALVSSPDGHLV